MLGGLLSFIPYVGSLTVLVLSLGVAIVQGWPSWSLFLLSLGVVGIGQFLEGYVLSPKLVGRGRSACLHPVWLMFALVAFQRFLFGFTGLIIAVPTAAAIGVLARHLIGVYLASPFYRGHREAEVKAGVQRDFMTGVGRQLPLELPHEPSFAREDFLAAPANSDALRAIDSWPDWAGRMLLLVGPPGSGKSHLGAIWAYAAQAAIIEAEKPWTKRRSPNSRKPRRY